MSALLRCDSCGKESALAIRVRTDEVIVDPSGNTTVYEVGRFGTLEPVLHFCGDCHEKAVASMWAKLPRYRPNRPPILGQP